MQLPLVPRMCPSPAPWAPAPAADHPLHLRSLRVGAAGSTLLLAVHPLSRGDRRTAARRSRTARCAVEEDEHAKAVQQWVQDVVIGYNFCPYAQPAAAQGHLRVVTSTSEVPEGVLEDLSAEAVKDLEDGQPATTLLVCPHVKAWKSFEAFQEFYQNELSNGYYFAEQDIYMVSFHPEYGQGAGLQLGDLIQLGEQRATIRDTCAGYSASGLPLAMVELETGEESFIELPPPIDAIERLVSRGPRVAIHLLRNRDLEEANDADIHRRNGRTIQEVGSAAILDAIRRCA
ncbi:Uncharacterized protein SCF082_LOCUS53513 [Durusdinium trenchii]|uniref:DUF1415 domain-containing protein n=1 Tax=Durusdinium trenchii TaxID=1381693 RepID=A0ABP0STG6_9DINO